MIHLRRDGAELNKDAKMHCGLGWPLPEGDKYVFEAEISLHRMIDCPGCNGDKPPRELGTPISELSGQPGKAGYDRFCEIARSWGYD